MDVDDMVWYVVKFTKENSFEVVPKAWYVESSLECFWPPSTYKKEKILKLIESCEGPGTDWKVHPSKRLGTYGDLKEARKKAQKALATSDLSCDEGALNTKRKKRKNPKFISDSEPESNDSDDNSYPTFKKGFSSIKNTSQSLTLDRKMQSKKTFKRYRSRSYSPPASEDLTPGNLLNISLTNNEESNLSIGNVLIETSRQEKGVDSRNVSTVTPSQQRGTDNIAFDNDFKKMVLNELSHLHLKINAIGENVCSLMAFNTANVGIALPGTSIDQLTILNKRLPIKSIEELNELEKWLAEEKNYKLMVTEFKRIGGQSMPQTIRRIMYRALTNLVGSLFSWDGAKKKSPFKHFLLARGILDAVKTQYTTATENEIIEIIRIWMVKAKERMKNEKQIENVDPANV